MDNLRNEKIQTEDSRDQRNEMAIVIRKVHIRGHHTTTVLFSGGEKHENGVGLLFDKLSAKAIVSWESVSDRIITARLKTRFTNVTVIQIYAPTETSWEKDKDDFCDQLNAVMDAAPSYDLKVVMHERLQCTDR